jgi:hypothetical protein
LVPEGPFAHKIMVPFDEVEPVEVTWIRAGSFTVAESVARIKRADGQESEVSMMQRWAVRRPIPGCSSRPPRSSSWRSIRKRSRGLADQPALQHGAPRAARVRVRGVPRRAGGRGGAGTICKQTY